MSTAGNNQELSLPQGKRNPEAAAESSSRKLLSRILMACLFWLLCLTLTAAGHRFYKATVKLDRHLSANRYQTHGSALVWVGYGSAEDARGRIADKGAMVPATEINALPNSAFWLAAATSFTVLGGLMAWSGRWIVNDGLQSLMGLFAGHLLWLGAIEFGLDAAGRRLGLAGSLEVVGDKVVGTHGASILIQLSVVFLVPMVIGLAMHESNRCALFQWFRRRLPITQTVAASGRVENYSARTAMQYFMTVWFCYVSVLWLADPRWGRFSDMALLTTMLGITVATPYMIWRTVCLSGQALALRYSVSGAIVTWTGIEIAAAMDIFKEPWLSNSFLSGAVLLGLSLLLTGLAVRILLPRRPGAMTFPAHATAVFVLLMGGSLGCTQSGPPERLTAETIATQLREYDQQIQGLKPSMEDGVLHALYSHDPKMKAQAAIAFGKSRRVSRVVKGRLESMAMSDESRLSQFAALKALGRLKLMSPPLQKVLSDLGRDPEWGTIAENIQK